MKKKIAAGLSLVLTALLFAGCALRTVDEMYALPRRSAEYKSLQSAIDMAMYGQEYCAPLSGENRQTVQTADLNGDGLDEYLVFAKGTDEKYLHILIFNQDSDGKAHIFEIIKSNGTAFEQVEYVNMDDKPGCELVVGRQVSDQVQRSVSVYSFYEGNANQIFNTGYAKFLTCDLSDVGREELLVIQFGEGETDNGVAALYSYREGQMERSVEVPLSQKVENIKRTTVSKLQGGNPAVYLAGAVEEDTIVTDILSVKDGRFTNLTLSGESGGVQTLRNYYVYGDDIDGDGVLELPDLISMEPISQEETSENRHLIRWYAVDTSGAETDKLYSFHNYVGGWYVTLDSAWARQVSVSQTDNVYEFSVRDEKLTRPLFRVYTFTGSDRGKQASADGRFLLYRAEGAVYAADFEKGAEKFGINGETLINRFHLIHQDWKTGET